MFKVQSKMCSTCIYRKGCTLDTPQLERDALKKDGYRICHHSKDVCCFGFWMRHASSFNLGRIAQRLHMVAMVHVDIWKRKKKPTQSKDQCNV